MEIEPYEPSEFVKFKKVHNIPPFRIKLANLPTPLTKWSFIANGQEFSMLIKRDDLTDLTGSGNKIRKLEFIIPEIINESHDWVVSLGPIQSNSCRVLSTLCPKLGLKSAHILIIRENEPIPIEPKGNLFFHRILGSKIYFKPRKEYLDKGQNKLLQEVRGDLIQHFEAKNPYIVKMGGSTPYGLFGYIECYRELEIQLKDLQPNLNVDEVFFACGSGGTAAGLAIAKYLSKSESILKNTKLIGYTVFEGPDFFHNYVNEMLEQLGLGNEVRSEDIITFIKATGLGYGANTKKEIEVIKEIAKSSGVVLDGTYTGKALYEFTRNAENSRKNVIFIHTGGLYSMFGDPKYFDEDE